MDVALADVPTEVCYVCAVSDAGGDENEGIAMTTGTTVSTRLRGN